MVTYIYEFVGDDIAIWVHGTQSQIVDYQHDHHRTLGLGKSIADSNDVAFHKYLSGVDIDLTPVFASSDALVKEFFDSLSTIFEDYKQNL